MINEIYPHILNTTFSQSLKTEGDDYILCYKDSRILLKKSGDILEIPKVSDITPDVTLTGLRYLFSLNSGNCFLAEDFTVEDGSFVYYEVSALRYFNRREFAWIGVLGFQLMNWYNTNKFCGKCGSKTEEKKDERAILCPACSNIVYPKISPAIIVAITCNDKILLAKGKNYRGGFYALIAGYVDIGESLEETVIREVKEEIGIDIKNIVYYKSQPWPFSGSLMIGFFAEADDTQPIKIDEKEIETAGWFRCGNLPEHAPSIGISGDMIDAFENKKHYSS